MLLAELLVVEWLGYVVDLRSGEVSLPAQKAAEMVALLDATLRRTCVTRDDLQQLCRSHMLPGPPGGGRAS